MKKQSKLTLSFPKKDLRIKEELIRMKIEDDINVSSFILSCVKKEIGYL